MTALQKGADHLLALSDWDALPDDVSRHYELVEGVIVASPRPITDHQYVVQEIAVALDHALRPRSRASIDVELIVAATPPTVRAPDVVVLHHRAARGRSRHEAEDVLAVVEVMSPGSRRTDRIYKMAEYAEVGIECYLLVEPGPPTTMTELRLRGTEYERVAEHSGSATLTLDGTEVVVDLAGMLGA